MNFIDKISKWPLALQTGFRIIDLAFRTQSRLMKLARICDAMKTLYDLNRVDHANCLVFVVLGK